MLETAVILLPLLEFVIFFYFLFKFYLKFWEKTKEFKDKTCYITDRLALDTQIYKLQDQIVKQSFTATSIFGTVYFITIFLIKRGFSIDYITQSYTDNYLIYSTICCSLSLIVHNYISRKLGFYIISLMMTLYLPFTNLRSPRGHSVFLLRSIISLETTAFFLGHKCVLISLISHIIFYIFANYCSIEGFKIICYQENFEIGSNVEYIFTMLWLFNYSFRLETRNNRILGFVDRSTKAKMEFLSRMSQQIRTPLFGILGSLDLLKNDGLTNSQKATLRTIRSCCENLSTTIRNVLDLSRIEYGNVIVNETIICLNDLIDECIFKFIDQLKNKGIEMKKVLIPPLPRYFIGDRHRIKQIISNLISNSINFNEKDGLIELTVTTDDEEFKKICNKDVPLQKKRRKSVTFFNKNDNTNGYIHFILRDTGIGIEESMKDKIFHPFVKAINPYFENDEGIGLGLTVAKHYANDIGGRLEFHSEGMNKGSIFCFSVPYKVPTSKKITKFKSLTQYSPNEIPSYGHTECSIKTYRPRLKKSCSHGDFNLKTKRFEILSQDIWP